MTMNRISDRVGVRRSLRRQRGQALPLGALGLLIMALAIIATMNLGQAVHEKIKLQNSADAAAYSLAAMEARAFNFIALTNRVQIVHYNAAMSMQSYLSYAGYCLAMFGTVKDLLADLAMALQTGCQFPYPANVPYCAILPAFEAVARVAGIIFNIIKMVYKFLHETAVPTVEALGSFNRVSIWQMQFIRALQINTHLLTGMQDFVLANDPTMTYTAKNQIFTILLNSTLNSLEFRSAFDRSSGLNPFILDSVMYGYQDLDDYTNQSTKEAKTAQSIMTEIANASRSDKNIYDRTMGGFTVTTWGVSNVGGAKHGQTKFVEKGDPEPGIEEMHEGESNYLVGDTLASDDYLQFGVGVATAGIAWVFLFPQGAAKIGDGIIADKDGGKHYKYDTDAGNDGGAPGGMSSVLILPPAKGNVPDTFTKDGDNDHKWPGMAPFFKFSPNAERNQDFNQPSTWIFLNKHHSAFQSGGTGSGGRPWHYKFTWDNNGSYNDGMSKNGKSVGGGKYNGAVSLDTTIGGERNSFLFEGLNAISRGMVYYHRPGNWSEPPNFFNPFWRARLAPVGAKLMNVWERFLGSKIKYGGDSAVMKMVVNFARNLISDVFLRTITAVMTH